jgi:muramidase (phage lysozyme)
MSAKVDPVDAAGFAFVVREVSCDDYGIFVERGRIPRALQRISPVGVGLIASNYGVDGFSLPSIDGA